jgi:hypothetical protein
MTTPDLSRTAWHKSSFSGSNGGQCVELAWRKSSFSGGNGGECVELARPGAIRDSKNPDGPTLSVSPLGTFLAEVKTGQFDRP